MRPTIPLILALILVSTSAMARTEAPADTLQATMEEVVVTGTRSEKLLIETPVRTQVVGRDEIVSMQAQSLADAVEFVPGVRVLSNCQNCNFATLSLLGLEGQYTQVLYDSQPTFSALSLVYGLEQIPARMIERIEVIKGGGSALYGPGAVGGVVNVIPRVPMESRVSFDTIGESVDGSNRYTAGLHADVVSEDRMTAATVFAQGGQLDAYDRNGDGFTEIGRRQSSALGARILHDFDEGDQAVIDFSRVYEDRRGGNLLDAPPFQADITEWIRTWRTSISGAWERPWTETFRTNVSLSYVNTERQTYYGGGGDLDAYGSTDNPLTVTDAQFQYYLGSHALTWGLQYSADDLTDRHPGHDRIIEEIYTNAGFYLQDDWQIADPLALVYGGRVDKHSELDDAIVSPRFSLLYDAPGEIRARASYSTGFLAPQVFDEDLHIMIAGGDGSVIRNDPDLKEESSVSYMIGVETTPRIGNGFGRFEVNFFRTELTDAFNITDALDDPDTGDLELTRVNAGDATVQGIEVSVGYMNSSFETQFGWVFQTGEFGEPQDFGETDFFRLPNNYGVFQTTYRNPTLADAFLGVRILGEEKIPHYAGFIPEDRLETTEAFIVFDASLSRRLPVAGGGLTFTLGGRNLTDAFQDDFDRGVDRDTGYLYGPRQPRTWYATLGYDF